MGIPHPAFPHDWPDDMHPMGWVFLHPPSDTLGSPGIGFEADQINGLAKFVFDDLGAKLYVVEPRTYRLEISVGITGEDHPIGQPYEHIIEGADHTAVKIASGSLPPDLKIVGGRIVGTPMQSGIWLVDIHVGPLLHYQPPLNDGPIGTYNRGRWVDINKELEYPDHGLTKEMRDELRAKLDELDAQEAEAETDRGDSQ